MKIGILMNPHGKAHARFGADKFKKLRDVGFDGVFSLECSPRTADDADYEAQSVALREIAEPILK